MTNYKYIFIFIMIFSTIEAQSISFKKEIIEVKIIKDFCTLTGDYFFENDSFNIEETQIYYPFVINNSLLFPDSISVYNISTMQSLPFKILKDGVSFSIKVKPNSIIQLKVTYKQKILNNYFEYILTTTSAWKKSLESSTFNIILPHSYLNPVISYNIDSIAAGKEFTLYSFTKENFLPDKNLIIKW